MQLKALLLDSLAPLTAVDGFCESNRCDTSMYLFVAFFALTVFIHSTSEVGGMLIIMRCTHPKDKAMAMGIIQFSLSLLSNIPCPHIFARIIDRACIVWAKMCGDDDGYCTMYDADSFRRFFFGKFSREHCGAELLISTLQVFRASSCSLHS